MRNTVTSVNGHPAKPILKWAGGKRQLLPELMKRVPGRFNRYAEPFFGGGALFFELHKLGRIRSAYISDKNKALIEVYLAVRNRPRKVIEALKTHALIHSEDWYYEVRSLDTWTLNLAERAARVIYLNRTCFNGLYRENSRGLFNVPFGRYRNPRICDEGNLKLCSKILKGAAISCSGFSQVLERVSKGDFVYFDPPYHPLSRTSSFTAYEKDGFAEKDHQALRDVFAELDRMGCYAMLSNSDTPFTRRLYSKYKQSSTTVLAARSVNSKASARGKIGELLVTNY